MSLRKFCSPTLPADHPLAPPNAVTDGQNLGRMKNARREMVGGR